MMGYPGMADPYPTSAERYLADLRRRRLIRRTLSGVALACAFAAGLLAGVPL